MKRWFLFPSVLGLIFLAACAPVESISGLQDLQLPEEKLEGIDLSLPSEEEEAENMINARLEHERQMELRRQGLIAFGQCRSGVQVPDRVTSKVIALTFDDGPNPATTNRILDILRARGIKATFFVLGSKAKANPSIIERMKNEGHVIASHSQTHKNFASISTAQTNYEIKTPNTLLSPYMIRGKFFRFPYGQSSCQGNEILDSLRYQPAVGWHIDSCDWAMTDGYFSASEARVCSGSAGPVNYLSHVMRMINRTGGGIALFHDIHEATARNLNQIIDRLVAANYKFVTVNNKIYFPKLNSGLNFPSGPQASQQQPNRPVDPISVRPSFNSHPEAFFQPETQGSRPVRVRSQDIDPLF